MKHRSCFTCVRVGVVGVGVFCSAASSLAEERMNLQWEAPAECPTGPRVLDKVRDIVGAKLAQTASLDAEGRIVEVEGGYRLDLTIEHDDGQRKRSVNAKACSDLLGAAAVVLGLHLRQVAAEENTTNGNDADAQASNSGGAIDSAPSSTAGNTGPDTTTTDSAPETKPSGEPPARTESPEEAGEEPDAGTSSGRIRGTRYVWLALPQGFVVLGFLPAPSWSFGGALGVRRDDWSFWLGGRYQTPRIVADATLPRVEATIDRYSVEFGVSNGWTSPLFQFAPGVFVGLDHLVARGGGAYLDAARSTHTYGFLGAGVTLRWFATDWLTPAIYLLGEASLSRPRIVVEPVGAISQISSVNFRAGLGFEWNL